MNMDSHPTPSISSKSVARLRFDMKDGYPSYTDSSIEKNDEKSEFEPATFDGWTIDNIPYDTVRYIYGWTQRKQRKNRTRGTQFEKIRFVYSLLGKLKHPGS